MGLALLQPADLGQNLELGRSLSPSSRLPFSTRSWRHSSPETCSSMKFQGNRKALLPPEWLLARSSIWSSDHEGHRRGTAGMQKARRSADTGQFAEDTHHLAGGGGRGLLRGDLLTAGGKEAKPSGTLKQETRSECEPVNYVAAAMEVVVRPWRNQEQNEAEKSPKSAHPGPFCSVSTSS